MSVELAEMERSLAAVSHMVGEQARGSAPQDVRYNSSTPAFFFAGSDSGSSSCKK